MTPATAARPPGRPREEVDAAVFAATLRTVHDQGYTRASVDRIAAAAGVAKTTVYRRWPTKGELIVACLLNSFGAVPLSGDDPEAILAEAIRWLAAKIGEPGVGAAFAGVFTDAVNDPALRRVLVTTFQEPYKLQLEELLGASEKRVLFLIDTFVGTLLHRMGISGAPMVADEVEDLIRMVLWSYRDTGG